MSRQAEAPPAALIEAEPLYGSIALPFEPPAHFTCPAGLTLAELVERLIGDGVIDRAWAARLDLYVDDWQAPRELWSKARPRPGRLIGIRARPGDPGTIAWLISYAINAAIAFAVQTVIQAFVGGGHPAAQSFEQILDIDASRNEVAQFRKVPAVLGTFRTFPPHAAKAYTIGADEKVILRMLFSWGLGPVSVSDLKIGDTPIGSFTGVTVQHKLKPGDPYPTIFPSSADEDEGPGLMEYADGWVARVTSSGACDELQVELTFTEGLIFYSSDGDIKAFGVDLRIRYREQGSSTWLDFQTGAAAAEGHLYQLTGYKKRKPFRMTFKRQVPRGRYEVAVKRVWEDDPGPKGKNAFAWSVLRSFTYDPPVTDDNLAITAVEIEAGDQLNGVIDLFNGVVSRHAPRWNAETESFGAAAATSNPAELVRWIATGPGAARPRDPDTEIDNAAFGAWAELCAAKGWRCDMELRAGAGQDEIMETVARCGRGALLERGGKLTVVVDDVQPAPAQIFTPRNSWGFRSSRRYLAPTHALRCQFNNEEKAYVRDEMFVYYPGYSEANAESVRAVPMVGKTSPAEVYKSAKRIIAEELLRVEDYSWRCDIEHLTLSRGKRVALSHYVIAVGRTQARVKARTLNGPGTHVTALTLDEVVKQTPGDTYGLSWRRVEGNVISVEAIALTNMGNGEGRVVTLATPLPLASAPKEKDLVVFGDAGIETIDAVVQNIGRASKFEAEITAVPYAAALFDGDLETLPPWSSNVSGESFPRPPAPIIQGVSADTTGIFAAYTFPLADADRVAEVEAYWKQAIDPEAAFELVAVIPREVRVAAFPPGEAGRDYQLKLVAVGRVGNRSIRTPSVIVTIASGAVSEALTGFLTNESHIVTTAADGTGGDYSSAGGAFKLSRGALDVSNGADPDIDTTYEVVSATAGLSITIGANGLYTITDLTVDNAQATLRGTNRGQSVEKIYSISKARAVDPLNFAPIASSNMTILGRSLRKLVSGDAALIGWDDGDEMGEGADTFAWDLIAWDGEVASAESYVGGANVLGVVVATDKAFAFGMSQTPLGDDHYESIDFCWHLGGDGKWRIYERGVLVWDNVGAPISAAVNDVPAITYDGSSVRYYLSGVLKAEHTADANLRLFFDASFYSDGARLDGVSFTAAVTSGQTQEKRYKRSFARPATPVSADPADWTLAPQTGSDPQWSITATRSFSGALLTGWSPPQLETRPFFCGPYNSATTYCRDYQVTLAGSSYICIVDTVTGQAPSGTAQDNAWWALVSQAGSEPPPETPPSAYTATIALPSSAAGVNLYDLLVAHGYTGHGDSTITFEINNGVVITGLPGVPDGGKAISTGTPPAGYTHAWTLRAKAGSITRGGGGKGGKGGDNLSGPQAGGDGGKGGDALDCLCPLTVLLDSGAIFQGGGGGGGGGNGKNVPGRRLGGGGGGGGKPNGQGGVGGDGSTVDGNSGEAATTSTAGNGGTVGFTGYVGWTGADYGAAAYGLDNSGAGGAGGYCIRKNGHAVTVTNSGATIAGTIG